MNSEKLKKIKNNYFVFGIVLGVVYGIVTRLVFGEKAELASLTYLFLIPTILGMIPFLFTEEIQVVPYKKIIFIPWLTLITFFITMFLLGLEDFLCLFILAAPFFLLATLGAFKSKIRTINKLIKYHRQKQNLLVFAILPFLLAPLENIIANKTDVYSVINTVDINNTKEKIWQNIVEVNQITENEFEVGLFNKIGVPRPLSATVDKFSLDGTRIGNFEGGLKFIEKIKTYEIQKSISFDIHIDSNSIRQKVFDQHVLLGNYFKFLDARYDIIQISNNKYQLKLTSRYQITSKVNFFGEFWGNIILSDFQGRLLKVIQNRCNQFN